MLRETILNIFGQTWPMILICTTIIISMRVAFLLKNRKSVEIYKELLMLLFIIYIMFLFYVVTFQDVTWSTSNLIPFKEILRYEFGSRLFFLNVIGNMLMFIPYGFFIGYILKTKKITTAIILAVIASMTIEITQLQVGRVFDIDDIMLNVVGVILGFYLYRFLDSIKERLPHIFKNSHVYNAVVIVLLTLFILYLFNFIGIGV
ncbi:MAG: VanZ family protein [Bacilli bacterium]